jgi:hypothetical protein
MKTFMLDKVNIKFKENFIFVFLILLIIISRIPFISSGYGIDPDSYRVAKAAKDISETGTYHFSRYPGYPFQEILCSFIYKGGPIALNGASAFFSVIGILFLILSMKKMGFDTFTIILSSLALAFNGQYFINSVSSKDYVWALGLILGSFYFIITKRPLISGFLLGLAIGTRITSFAMIIPFSILLFEQVNFKKSILKILFFIVTTMIIGFVCFLPPIITLRGFGFLQSASNNDVQYFLGIKAFVIDFVGPCGFIVMASAIIYIFFRILKSKKINFKDNVLPTANIYAFYVLIFIYLLIFIKLPHQPAYLLPILPFILILLANYLNKYFFIVVCISIALSSFIGFESVSKFKINSPIISDHINRIENEYYINKVVLKSNSLEKASIMAGYYLPLLDVSNNRNEPDSVKFYYSLDKDILKFSKDNKYSVYFLQHQNEYNIYLNNIDLEKEGGSLLDIDSGKKQE